MIHVYVSRHRFFESPGEYHLGASVKIDGEWRRHVVSLEDPPSPDDLEKATRQIKRWGRAMHRGTPVENVQMDFPQAEARWPI